MRHRTDFKGGRDQTALVGLRPPSHRALLYCIEIIMKIVSRWAKLFAALGGARFASRPPSKRDNEKQASTTDLHDWENEGGNLAPSPKATDGIVTTGSA